MALLELFKSFTRGQENAQDQLNANFAALEGVTVVEYGDNPNGNWIKFGDGSMICTIQKEMGTPPSTAFGQLFRNTPERYRFPQVFIATPAISSEVISGIGMSWTILGGGASTNIEASIGVAAAIRETVLKPTIAITAVGRWK